ncbi:MAG: PHP domain-containing protein [Clostridiales Family XIII bacterium]|jgi:putative hydrolase|nr:PHP domain-containing protein [Clostridiales Family XIII bacterium]
MSIDQPASRSQIEYTVNGRRYALLSDLHTHTVYSHGSGTVRDNVLAARGRGIRKIGISDHGPGHLGFGVQRRKLAAQKAEILALRKEFPDMEIYFSVEANILPDGKLDVKPEEFSYFDYVCAGWHYGAVGGLTPRGVAQTLGNFVRRTPERAKPAQVARNTETVIAALENNRIHFLTHPGDNAPVDLGQVAEACARTDTLVEINTGHRTLTPLDVRDMARSKVRFLLSSDAHSPARVGDFFVGVQLLLEAGVDLARVVNLRVEG